MGAVPNIAPASKRQLDGPQNVSLEGDVLGLGSPHRPWVPKILFSQARVESCTNLKTIRGQGVNIDCCIL